MSTPTKTKTSPAYAAARKRREEAELRHVEAESALQAAKDHYANLVALNRKGALTVSGLDLLTAEANVTVVKGLLAAATDAVNESRALEAPLLAQHWADLISGRLKGQEGDLVGTAVAEITASLRKLTDRTNERHELFATAIQDALAVGILDGFPDEGLSFGYVRGFMSPGVIYVNGEKIEMVESHVSAKDVLISAVNNLGLDLTTRNGEVAVEPRLQW